MIIGSMKEEFLWRARDVFLFDCKVAGLDERARCTYQDVLGSFIRFTGNIRVRQLTPDHVRMYISNLSDGPSEGEDHDRLVMSQYAMIHTWIRWMYVQKFITERDSRTTRLPDLTSLFPSRITWKLAHYWKYPLSI